jgi:hypothetical protein
LLLIPLIVGTIIPFTARRDGYSAMPTAFWAAALLAVFLLGDGAATLFPSLDLGF